jgi:hypothetical protein
MRFCFAFSGDSERYDFSIVDGGQEVKHQLLHRITTVRKPECSPALPDRMSMAFSRLQC